MGTKTVKRWLSLLLALVMVVTAAPLAEFAGLELFPSASAATNGHSQAEAISWLNQKVGIKIGNGECPALAREYYAYLGYSVSGNGKDYEYNVPSGWVRTYYSAGFVPQPGDIAVWRWTNTTGGKKYGHVAIVKSADANGMICYEQGASAGYKVRSHPYSYSLVTCFIRPDFVTAHIDPPTWALTTADKTRVRAGTSISFSFSADQPVNFVIGIDRNNERILTQDVSSPFTFYCEHTGFYSAYVTAHNAAGGVDSNRVYWVVYDNSADDGFYAYIIKQDSWIHLENGLANVRLRSANANASYDPKQIWKFVRQPDESYKIINQYDKTLLDVDNLGTANGTNVSTYADNGGANQKWYLCTINGSTYIVASYVDKVLDVTGGQNAPGTNVQIYDYNGTTAQRFSVYHLTTDSLNYAKPGKPDAPTVEVKAGFAGKETEFSWTNSPAKNAFDKRSYRVVVKNLQNEIFVDKRDLTSRSLKATLPAGAYFVFVDAINENYPNYYSRSMSVSFTVNEHTHDWGSGVVTKEPTCTAAGERTYTCTCGETKTETIPAADHSWNEVVTKEATLTEVGERTLVCSVCGERRVEQIEKYAVECDPTAQFIRFNRATLAVDVLGNAPYSNATLELYICEQFAQSSDEATYVKSVSNVTTSPTAVSFDIGVGKEVEYELHAERTYNYTITLKKEDKVVASYNGSLTTPEGPHSTTNSFTIGSEAEFNSDDMLNIRFEIWNRFDIEIEKIGVRFRSEFESESEAIDYIVFNTSTDEDRTITGTVSVGENGEIKHAVSRKQAYYYDVYIEAKEESYQNDFTIYDDPPLPDISVEIRTPVYAEAEGQKLIVDVKLVDNPGVSYLSFMPHIRGDALRNLRFLPGDIGTSSMDEGIGAWGKFEDNGQTGTLFSLEFDVVDSSIDALEQAGIEIELLNAFLFVGPGDPREAECRIADKMPRSIANVAVSSVLAEGDPGKPDVKIGDANGDGKIDSKDILRLCNYLQEFDYDTNTSSVSINAKAADCNGDGKIDSKDILRLCNYLQEFDYDTGTSPVKLGK